MSLVSPQSLAVTLDNVNQAIFTDQRLSQAQRLQAASWLAQRQGKGSYRGVLFATAADDRINGSRLFTGEILNSNAGMRCKLGFEACRALILLKDTRSATADALARSIEGIHERLDIAGGTYCCGSCSVALMRLLAAGGLKNSQQLLDRGIKVIRSCRAGNGRWKRYPFYYTLLALSEIEPSQALEELRYAAPVLEKVARRMPAPNNLYAQRRHLLAQRILAQC